MIGLTALAGYLIYFIFHFFLLPSLLVINTCILSTENARIACFFSWIMFVLTLAYRLSMLECVDAPCCYIRSSPRFPSLFPFPFHVNDHSHFLARVEVLVNAFCVFYFVISVVATLKAFTPKILKKYLPVFFGDEKPAASSGGQPNGNSRAPLNGNSVLGGQGNKTNGTKTSSSEDDVSSVSIPTAESSTSSGDS